MLTWLPLSLLAAPLLSLAGCQFDRPANIGPIDALTIDAVQVCTPGTERCTTGHYTACDAAGQYVTHLVPNGADGAAMTLTMDGYQCPMGCHATRPQCADIDAANGLNAALDQPATSATGLDLVLPRAAAAPPGVVVIDTDDFSAALGETTITDVDRMSLRVPARVITQVAGPEILVLQLRTFTIRPGRVVEVRGRRALGIAAHFDVFLGGTLDLSAELSTGLGPAPGAVLGASCDGGQRKGVFGGGGNIHDGGDGSNGASGGELQSAGALRGGCLGQNTSSTPPYGGGGGAVQIVTRTRIALGSAAVIDVSGGGGGLIPFGIGLPSGGGSGGTVLLQAPLITPSAGVLIAGRGGSGAAGNVADGQIDGVPGIEGTLQGLGAEPVTCSGCGLSGRGGTESALPGSARQEPTPPAAGGGGSVGRCDLYTASGGVSLAGAAMRIVFRGARRLEPRSP